MSYCTSNNNVQFLASDGSESSSENKYHHMRQEDDHHDEIESKKELKSSFGGDREMKRKTTVASDTTKQHDLPLVSSLDPVSSSSIDIKIESNIGMPNDLPFADPMANDSNSTNIFIPITTPAIFPASTSPPRGSTITENPLSVLNDMQRALLFSNAQLSRLWDAPGITNGNQMDGTADLRLLLQPPNLSHETGIGASHNQHMNQHFSGMQMTPAGMQQGTYTSFLSNAVSPTEPMMTRPCNALNNILPNSVYFPEQPIPQRNNNASRPHSLPKVSLTTAASNTNSKPSKPAVDVDVLVELHKAQKKYESSSGGASSRLFTTHGGRETFPMILHRALVELESIEGGRQIASFMPDGKSFQIRNHYQLEEKVLPVFFPKMKGFASFQRQLNLYEFKRSEGSGIDRGTYHHELFIRDDPSVSIQRMKRTKVRGVHARRLLQSGGSVKAR